MGSVNVNVTFYREISEPIYDTTAPYLLDVSRSDLTGTGRAMVDLENGILRVRATANQVPQFTVRQGTDSFVVNTGGSGACSDQCAVDVSGTGLITQQSQSLGITATVGRPGGGGSSFFTRTWQAGAGTYPVTANVPFSIEASPTYSLTVTPGVPFELYYDLRLDTRYGGTLDFEHTALLQFDLPAGATVQSIGGYVPEPTALTLLIPAMGLVARRRAPKAE